MAIKVYVLKYPDDIGTNPDVTLNFDKAMKWLNHNKEYKCEVLEYLASNDIVCDKWERCWLYHEGKLHSLNSGEYLN